MLNLSTSGSSAHFDASPVVFVSSGRGLSLVAGDPQPTSAVAAVRSAEGSVAIVRTARGGGIVPRSSALADGREGSEWTPLVRSPVPWTNVTFLFTDHVDPTRDPAFADNVLHLLLEEPPPGSVRPERGEGRLYEVFRDGLRREGVEVGECLVLEGGR